MNRRNEALSAMQKARVLEDATPNGYVQCITCGRIIRTTEADGGHYIPRRFRSTELEPTNVNAQCRECNRFKGGKPKEYRARMIARYGLMEVERLEGLKASEMGGGDYSKSIEDYGIQARKWRRVVKELKYKEGL